MLKEDHRLFDVAEAGRLDAVSNKLDQYELILIPGIPFIKSKIFIEALKHTKACVVSTGLSFIQNETDLKEIFGVSLKEKLEQVRGGYLLTEPKSIFKHFEKRDWVYLDMEYYDMDTSEGNRNMLPLITPSRYGPPERCFGHQITNQPSVTIKDNAVYFPWRPGTLYYKQGFEDFKCN